MMILLNNESSVHNANNEPLLCETIVVFRSRTHTRHPLKHCRLAKPFHIFFIEKQVNLIIYALF